MSISSAEVARLLEPGLNAIVGMSYKPDMDEWKELGFAVNKAKLRVETDIRMSGFGIVPDKAEGAPIVYDVAQEGFTSRYVQKTKALAFAVTEEAIEDTLYISLMPKFAKALKKSFVVTKNREGANIYNRAFSGSYLGGDGVSLCSTAHPLAGGGTQANMLAVAADLSEAALEDMLTSIGTMVDDRGLPCNLKGQKLVVSNVGGNHFEAMRILGSEYRPGLNTNDINAIYKNKYLPQGMANSQYLTDADAFFILTDADDGLKYFEKRAFVTKMEGDFETGNMKYKGSERYVFGWTDFRHVYGSAGA